jgi:hypothetical protein
MKKLIKLAIVIAICCIASVVAVLEVFDLHPQLNVGNVHSVWNGLRKMSLESGSGIIPYTDGRKELHKVYHFGPIQPEHVVEQVY